MGGALVSLTENSQLNRLKFSRAYLVGPMDRAWEESKEWRTELQTWLNKQGILVYNPYEKPLISVTAQGLEDDDGFKLRVESLEKEDYDKTRSLMKNVRTTDLRLVDHSDFLVVNFDLTKIPCGTYEEAFWANREKKPVIFHCVQGKKNMPHWMFGTFPHELFFDSWSAVRRYILHIAYDPDIHINTLNRWMFFNLEPQIKKIIENDK